MRVGKRLAKLAEALAVQQRADDRPRVVVWLPRKTGDTQPLGVVSQRDNVLTVLYDREHPNPPLPDGW